MDKLNLSLFKEKKLPPLSVDIVGIIRLYLLPCRKQIKYNRQLVFNQLYGSTWWIKYDLNRPENPKGYRKYNIGLNCWCLSFY